MENNELFICDKCRELTGMCYKRKYSPVDYLHGKRSSPVWIIGLNPAGEIGYNDENETIDHLVNSTFNHPYFKDFSKVSSLIYDALGKENGVAHVDLVKCFSRSFPLVNLRELLCNCNEYLREQLRIYSPKIIICNGIHVVRHIEQFIPPISKEYDYVTFYIGDAINNPIIFRSGFIGRIDNYAKRRLGIEIEKELLKNKIVLYK